MASFNTVGGSPAPRTEEMTPKAQVAFEAYRDMGPSRTLRGAADLLGLSPRSASHVRRWSAKYEWERLVAEHDKPVADPGGLEPRGGDALDTPDPMDREEERSELLVEALLLSTAGLAVASERKGHGLGVQRASRRINALVMELKPKGVAEVMLATQAVACHLLASRATQEALRSPDGRRGGPGQLALNAARTMARLLEALERKRRGSVSVQRVVVEHVTVADGGQAVIGNIGQGDNDG